MIERNIRKNKSLEPGSSGRRRKLNNFKLAVGMGSNWVDLDTGVMYMIQEYSDMIHDPKIPEDQKPTRIRMVNYKTGEDIGWADEYAVEQKMKDPEPDPRY